MDIKKFLETVDKFNFAGEKKGQQPGQQWRGTDKGLPGTKLVGELDKHVKETHVERKLRKDFKGFKDYKEFDSDDWAEWDAKIKRLKQRAKQGELVTVWDKEKRVYKNVPKSEIKEYQNRMDPDAQVTSPPSPDASQTAIDQVQDKIFARDVEGETVEEQTPAAPVVKPFGTPPAQTTTPPPTPAAQQFKFTPDQEKWLGGANRQDPDILKRMPGPKPGVDYFKGQDDQARAKTLNIGRSNLNTIKGAVGAQKDAPEVFPTKPATTPAVTAPKPQAAAPAPQTQTRPVVVDEPKKTATDPNAYRSVSTQKLTAPAAQQPAKTGRTTWQSLAKLNPDIKDPNKIYPGQEITLPDGSKAVVNKGDTLSGIAQRYRQGGYTDSTPVKTAPATATATPVKPQPDIKGTELPKVSGKAASQLQKGREYRARQAAKQDNTNLGGNAADPEAQAFARPDTPQTQTAKAEPSFSGRSKTAGGAIVDPNATVSTSSKPQAATTTKQPLSVRNNNPGNLRYAGQPGAVKDANGYARFETPEAGRAAMRRQLNLDMQRRGMNLTQALNKYAPPSDNNPTDKYIDFVANRVGIDPTKPIPRNKMAAIQRAMVEFEGGKRAVDAFYPKRTLVAKAGTTVESLMSDFRKFVLEYGNQQAPDQQATSQDSAESDAEAELKRQRMDKRVSQATLAGLSAVLPPGTNTAVAATALNKIVDQKPLSPQENQVIGTLMPLLARAAEEPSTSASLKTALGRAGMLTKLGKQ